MALDKIVSNRRFNIFLSASSNHKIIFLAEIIKFVMCLHTTVLVFGSNESDPSMKMTQGAAERVRALKKNNFNF